MLATGIPFEELTAEEAMKRWPQLKLDPDDVVAFQADAGIVEPWKGNALHANLARAHGAQITENAKILKIEPNGDVVKVFTSKGTFFGKKLVLCCGAWTNKILANLNMKLPINVTKEQVTFFATPHIRKFTPTNFPVFIHYTKTGKEVYGFPVFGEMGTKAGLHLGGKTVDPDTRTFEPDFEARETLIKCLQETMPEFLGPTMYTKTCLYSNTPDGDFILDTLPGFPHISVFVGDGHAYKWASFLGLALSQIALTGNSKYALSGFKFREGVQPELLLDAEKRAGKAKL